MIGNLGIFFLAAFFEIFDCFTFWLYWVTMYKKAHKIPTKSINSSSSKESESEELKRLRHENKILKQERDILKKAAAYFAKETL